MDKIKNCPAPLKRKLFLTVIIGFTCLLIGIAMMLLLKDRMMLFLSLAIFVLSIGKAVEFYLLIANKKYEIVEGTCVGIVPKPLRKYRKIRIMDDAGVESTMLLNKQTKVKIGYRYRFFFKETQKLSFGSEYLDSATSSDCFLGFEELVEFDSQEEITKPEVKQ